jgi:hypothetical protein
MISITSDYELKFKLLVVQIDCLRYLNYYCTVEIISAKQSNGVWGWPQKITALDVQLSVICFGWDSLIFVNFALCCAYSSSGVVQCCFPRCAHWTQFDCHNDRPK